MAKLEQGIQPFTLKVGTVVGYLWKGKPGGAGLSA